MRKIALALLAALVCVAGAQAQEEEKPPKASGVRITFLPPPIQGTLTLGIYNKAGKLVRVLHREATEKDFTIGLNGLITTWDGKDDNGTTVPPGKYSARGYTVGALDIEGVAYHCNDFMVDEDSPRIRQLVALRVSPEEKLSVSVKLADEKAAEFAIGEDGQVKQAAQPSKDDPETPASADGGARLILGGKEIRADSIADLQKPIDAAPGKDGTLWVIDQTSSGVEVKQYSATGEFLRRLAAAPEDPVPQKIVASKTQDRIYLLESSQGVQRLRGLARDDGTAPAKPSETATSLSTWKTLFSKQIQASEQFASVADKLGRPQAFKPEPQITMRLLPNPLFKNAPVSASLEVAYDAEGSYLRTTDALPLVRLTDTPHLKWVVMGRENGSRAVTIFQSDGAVVEEFRVRKLANMMAFDAGEYEWTGK
ncbi:hypothetical protein ACXR0O_10715 [Verrucomicrobiota bacterium sgz303538]